MVQSTHVHTLNTGLKSALGRQLPVTVSIAYGENVPKGDIRLVSLNICIEKLLSAYVLTRMP